MRANRCIAGVLIAGLVTGCATSRESFYANPSGASNAQICRSLASESVQGDAAFHQALRTELNSRGISEGECTSIVSQQNLAIGAGILLGAALIAAAANSGGGYGSGAYAPVTDYQWDWDQYYSSTYQLVWSCRGVQTGQFADQWRCAGMPQTDYRWPAK